MTAKQIHELTTSELILALIMNDRQACIEVNSRRGLTRKTDSETEKLLTECKNRELLTEEDAQDILK